MNRLTAKINTMFLLTPFSLLLRMQNILKLRHLQDSDHHLSHLVVIITEMYVHNFFYLV